MVRVFVKAHDDDIARQRSVINGIAQGRAQAFHQAVFKGLAAIGPHVGQLNAEVAVCDPAKACAIQATLALRPRWRNGTPRYLRAESTSALICWPLVR